MSDYSLEGIVRLSDQTGQATQSAAKNVRAVGDEVDETARKTSGYSDVLGVAKNALAAFGVVEAGKAIINLSLLGAQVERTERTFRNISGGELEAAENLDAMRQATRGAISDVDSMALANRLLQMGLADNAESLGELTKMSSTLGMAMGRDATSAVEEFSLLLANQSKLRLDTFGISVENVEKRIESLGRSNSRLSDQQIFTMAVMAEGEEAMKNLGDEVEDNQLAVEQAEAAWQNLKNEAGQAFAAFAGVGGGALGKVLGWLADQLSTLNQLTDEYGFLEARLRSIFGMFTGSSPWSAGDAPAAYDANGHRIYNNNVTMYGPNFNGVSNASGMLDQLQGMSP